MKTTLFKLVSSKYFNTGLGIGISVLCLYLALRNVNLVEIWQVLLQASPAFIGLALVSVMVNILSKAFRWRVLLGPREKTVPFIKILGMLLVGQMINLVVPGRLGDLTRA